jgi:hypothetical protein
MVKKLMFHLNELQISPYALEKIFEWQRADCGWHKEVLDSGRYRHRPRLSDD